MNPPKYTAQCHCGAVRYEVTADPVDAKYCHCRECQALHGAPFQWAAIFEKPDVKFVKGAEALRFYHAPSRTMTGAATKVLPSKVSCRYCNTPIADEGRRMWLAFPELFDFQGRIPKAFRPSCHIFYDLRVVDLDDDLPKWSGHKGSSVLVG